MAHVLETGARKWRRFMATVSGATVQENVCNNSKNVKSHVFLDFEEKKHKKT